MHCMAGQLCEELSRDEKVVRLCLAVDSAPVSFMHAADQLQDLTNHNITP